MKSAKTSILHGSWKSTRLLGLGSFTSSQHEVLNMFLGGSFCKLLKSERDGHIHDH